MTSDFSTWEFWDIYDTQPYPGAYLNPNGYSDMEIALGPRTITISALTYEHALMRGLRQLAEETGGELTKCELCGQRLRYAVLFFDADQHLHVVGQDCGKRAQMNVGSDEDWAILQAVKDAKEIATRNGSRWKADFYQPEALRLVSPREFPKNVSLWIPQRRANAPRYLPTPRPRITVWANDEAELRETIRAFRSWLRERKITVAQPMHRRRA